MMLQFWISLLVPIIDEIIRPRPIMLEFLPIMLLSSAQKSHPLCSILCP